MNFNIITIKTQMKPIAYFLLFIGIPFLYSCKKYPFFATAGATIVLSTDNKIINLNNNITVYIAGYNEDGTPLWDGTQVDLTISNGSLSENSVELENGRAQVEAFGDQERGEMKITAKSGSISTSEDPLIIIVGKLPEVSQIVSSLDPPILKPEGGIMKITISIYDEYYEPISNFPVIFETTSGILLSKGSIVYTDVSGIAIDYLETYEDGNVNIYAGNKEKVIEIKLEEEEVIIPNEPPVPTFQYSPQSPLSGETVYFNATGSYDPDGRITQFKWDFGDGTYGSGAITSHVYTYTGSDSSKTFIATLTVRDSDAETRAKYEFIYVYPPAP